MAPPLVVPAAKKSHLRGCTRGWYGGSGGHTHLITNHQWPSLLAGHHLPSWPRVTNDKNTQWALGKHLHHWHSFSGSLQHSKLCWLKSIANLISYTLNFMRESFYERNVWLKSEKSKQLDNKVLRRPSSSSIARVR